MNKINFFGAVFYTSMMIVLLWAILKSIDVINTQSWLENGLPIGSLAIGVLALYYNLINNATKIAFNVANITVKIESIEKDVEILKENNKKIEY